MTISHNSLSSPFEIETVTSALSAPYSLMIKNVVICYQLPGRAAMVPHIFIQYKYDHINHLKTIDHLKRWSLIRLRAQGDHLVYGISKSFYPYMEKIDKELKDFNNK